ncbi:MAG: VTT domain-containing protein [Patescibacteria group bacterium]
MALAITNLGHLAEENQLLVYFIIYLSTIFIGNLAAFGGFWLVFRGELGPWGLPLLIATLLLAEASGDILWYSLGQKLRGSKLGDFIRNKFTPQHDKIESSLQKNGMNWIFLSKFLYASAFPVIFTIGWAGVPFKKFLKVSCLAIALWMPILGGVAFGLVSSLTPLQATTIFRRVEILFLAGLGLFILIDYFLLRFVKKILYIVNDTMSGAHDDTPKTG